MKEEMEIGFAEALKRCESHEFWSSLSQKDFKDFHERLLDLESAFKRHLRSKGEILSDEDFAIDALWTEIRHDFIRRTGHLSMIDSKGDFNSWESWSVSRKSTEDLAVVRLNLAAFRRYLRGDPFGTFLMEAFLESTSDLPGCRVKRAVARKMKLFPTDRGGRRWNYDVGDVRACLLVTPSEAVEQANRCAWIAGRTSGETREYWFACVRDIIERNGRRFVVETNKEDFNYA